MTDIVHDHTIGDWRADYSAKTDETVCAITDSTMKKKFDDFYGMTVIIEHDGGIESVYYGLTTESTVKTGNSIKAGALIGSVGKEYHFEVLELVSILK